MPVEVQLRAAALQFDGTAGAGLFTFTRLDAMPRTTRVVVHSAAVAIDGTVTTARIFYRRPGGAPEERILIGAGNTTTMIDPVDPTPGADLSVCGRVVPRDESGVHWELVVITTGKVGDGAAIVDWSLQPYPDTSPQDAP